MFKKITITFIIFNLIFTNIVFSADTKLDIHYKKSDGYYDNTQIKILYDGKSKICNFNYKDDFGAILKTSIPFNELVEVNIFEEEKVIDNFTINMYENNEVWKEEISEQVYYGLPDLYNSNNINSKQKNIKVYYKRYDENYTNKKLLLTSESTKKVFNFTKLGDFAYTNISINDDEVYYFKIIENGNVVDFEKGVIYNNSLINDEIYLIQDKEIAHYDNNIFSNQKFIESAYIDQDNDIYVKLYTKDKIQDNLTQSFEINKLNGESVNINFVEPLDIQNDYCDLFKINVSNISITSKYVISKQKFGDINLSKKLIYDLEDYNDLLRHTENLGFKIEDNITKFNLFYPNAQSAKINIMDGDKIVKVYNFDKVENDVWQFETKDNLLGKCYNYEVTLNGVDYIVEEPFAKVLNKDGHSVIYNINSYDANKKINLENKYYNAIYTRDINSFVMFEDDVLEASTTITKPYSYYEDNKEIKYEPLDNQNEHSKSENIKNVNIKYFLYDEGYLDEKIVDGEIVEPDVEDEVVLVFGSSYTMGINNEESIYEDEEEITVHNEEENFEIQIIDTDEVVSNIDYSHFYFDYGVNIEIIRLDNNINKIKQFIKDMHDRNKKVIFNYTIDYDKIRYLCDEYYYSDGKINTNRTIASQSIYEDVQFLIDLYNIDGLTFDLNYFDEKFLEKLQNKFSNIKIIGINGNEIYTDKFYNISDFNLDYVNADESKNIYAISNYNKLEYELFLIMLNKSIPFFKNIKFENENEINEIFYNSNFLSDAIDDDMEILQNGEGYKLLKVKSVSNDFDYYTIAINHNEKEEMVLLPSKNNKVVFDNTGLRQNEEYITRNLLMKPYSVYLFKTVEDNISYNIYFKNIVPYIIIILLVILLFIMVRRRKRNKKIFI